MVTGVEVDLFKPDEYLKELSQAAIDLSVAEAFNSDDPTTVEATLSGSDDGREWIAKWDAVKDPWFNFSSRSSFYHNDRIWIEHKEIPYRFIRNYISKIRENVDLARPTDNIRAERDRIIAEYQDLLGSST